MKSKDKDELAHVRIKIEKLDDKWKATDRQNREVSIVADCPFDAVKQLKNIMQ